MLIATKQFYQCSIVGADDTVGTVKDLLFDDIQWVIRYFDIDTGGWLTGRRVILPPGAIQDAEYATSLLFTPLTRSQVEDSPSLLSDMPVTRQKEQELAKFYSWDAYWASNAFTEQAEGDPNLRSTRSVSGYSIEALDGDIGHIDKFIIDDADWHIRYLVIKTGNWLSGKLVLIPTAWAESIDWDSKHVRVLLEKKVIEEAPKFDPTVPINRQYEEVFYDYYGRPRYWTRTRVKV